MTQAVATVPRQRRPFRVARPFQYLALAGYIVFLGFPLLFLLTTAFKTPQELQSPNPTFLPTTFNVDNFAAAIEKANLIHAAGNSLFVAVFTTVIVTLISLPAAYALARFKTKLRGVATGWILLSQVFPFILIIIPLFLVLKQIGLINNLFGLILVYTVWSLPFALWMLQGYVAGIPAELEEAGAMDGASRIRILRSIVLPLLGPGLVATSLFTFISSWNEFFFALVLIQDPNLQTLPLTLARFVGAEGQVQLGQLAAASLLATIPSLAFFALIQRRLTSGLMSGAVKG
ncbi:carbohydrate ABC transporter permease [Humibacter sp. BT305]|uniref:Sugar ABC transporter permease n=1 Tax=Cnuibacter physcomitrellae TaxID=1619308 RepID=A0A1X9LQ50_9MICO|nr:carbohydrate ABC transporter permease [Cnuibacter physcomitrellae]ARJ06438.1 sugar ABC transporter permease [Cnuibacter physcomitrellae]AXH34942.1 carbohydrate ABC transporter permease [Humibacter sp. BT305]MCS5495752.1 carbohydrate ABC transporter permease [Cnuibacter physcomitrellae]GGI38010.1 sugar ABC transporter permease [Cnuibacter physcomitrellae]